MQFDRGVVVLKFMNRLFYVFLMRLSSTNRVCMVIEGTERVHGYWGNWACAWLVGELSVCMVIGGTERVHGYWGNLACAWLLGELSVCMVIGGTEREERQHSKEVN